MLRTAMGTLLNFLRGDLKEFAAEWRLNLAPRGSIARNPLRGAFWRRQWQQFSIEWRLDRFRSGRGRASRIVERLVLNVALLVVVGYFTVWLGSRFNPQIAAAVGGLTIGAMLRAMLRGEFPNRGH